MKKARAAFVPMLKREGKWGPIKGVASAELFIRLADGTKYHCSWANLTLRKLDDLLDVSGAPLKVKSVKVKNV